MRVMNKLSVGAALFGSVILAFAGAAQANDWHHWDHDHWDRGPHRGHTRVIERRVVEERPVYIHRPPVVVERRVMMAPPPVYYAPPAPSGLNLNFNIPLQ
jgi:hypothetical protein